MKNRIAKILGIGLTAGLIFGLIGAVFAAPASAGMMEWTTINTPSWEDLVILPASDILDYDIGGDGDTIYAALESLESCNGVGVDGETFALVKSTDGGVTWSDITANFTSASNLPAGGFRAIISVAVAPDDEGWLAVAGVSDGGVIWIVASQDGGDNFSYTGDITDGVNMGMLYDLAISIEVDGIHNIAVAGADMSGDGALFRLKAGTWLSASWEDTTDATDYLGWDDGTADDTDIVMAIAFSPNFDLDDTIVLIGIDLTNGVYYIQSGIWEGSGGSWNDDAGFPNATEIKADGDTLNIPTFVYVRCAGLTLPADYDGSDPGARAVFIYVNAINATSGTYGGCVFRVDNNTLSPVCGPAGDPLLSSIDVHGDADTGKLMIGEYIQYDNDTDQYIPADCCEGVRVWHTEELDFCCPQWDGACKNPSGFYMALVMYTPDGEKEYVTTCGNVDNRFGDTRTDIGTPLDESAFSVSLDDAISFNQLSLIDTDIDHLSDVAVCPDCSTIYLSTISESIIDTGLYFGAFPCGEGTGPGYCNCDSVWRSYDNGDTWERIFHGDWVDEYIEDLTNILLRLPCDAVEDCCDQDPVSPSGTLYVGLQSTDQMFYSRDCGQCWNEPPAAKVSIQDFAVESENIVYILDVDGMFSMSTQYGRRWSDAVDTGMDSGHTIVSCCNEGFTVAGGDGEVAWSDDGGDSWSQMDDVPIDDDVHVACAPNCENIIYAAVADNTSGGIFRGDITTGEWTDMNAMAADYDGIAVGRSDGTLYAVSDSIRADKGEVCKDRFAEQVDALWYSGVARNLTPCETDCCGTEDWDYLICGLSSSDGDTQEKEDFDIGPSALKICGCLSADTNSILWAIDTRDYDVVDKTEGNLWSYEDCAAKMGPTLTAPADGSVLDCEPCAGCDAANFTLKWERMCEACSYDIQIMDADGNLIVEWVDEDITGDPP
ncbi:hypothetical protein ACFLVY_02510, partial [Chloroflexota bacterium]